MKTLLTIYLLLSCSIMFAQDSTYYATDWITIGFNPQQFADSLEWKYGQYYLTSDSTFVQFRKHKNGLTQRREFLYKKD